MILFEIQCTYLFRNFKNIFFESIDYKNLPNAISHFSVKIYQLSKLVQTINYSIVIDTS